MRLAAGENDGLAGEAPVVERHVLRIFALAGVCLWPRSRRRRASVRNGLFPVQFRARNPVGGRPLPFVADAASANFDSHYAPSHDRPPAL